MIMLDILLGFFVGALCGIVPLLFGLLTKHKILGIIGIASSAVSGVIFALLDKSPFTSIGVAIVFAIAIFAKNKNKNSSDDKDDHDIYLGDE